MIEILKDYPDTILAVSGTGRVTSEDYRDVLIPEVEARIAKHEHIRLFCFLGPDFDGLTAGAAWADLKLGLSRWNAFGRIAVVTDAGWIADAVRLFAPFFYHPVKVFPVADCKSARSWIHTEETVA